MQLFCLNGWLHWTYHHNKSWIKTTILRTEMWNNFKNNALQPPLYNAIHVAFWVPQTAWPSITPLGTVCLKHSISRQRNGYYAVTVVKSLSQNSSLTPLISPNSVTTDRYNGTGKATEMPNLEMIQESLSTLHQEFVEYSKSKERQPWRHKIVEHVYAKSAS